MECNKWEEYGLLFTSGELDGRERQSFERHLSECSSCTQEEKLYLMEKERFYTPEILADAPSAACDAEIVRVCSDGRRKVTNMNTMPVFIKRTVLSVALFAIGFIGVGYVTLKSNNGIRKSVAAPTVSESTVVDQAVTEPTVTAGAGPVDSAADSSAGSGMNFSKTRGNLDLNGVYPVDLQNK